MSLLLDDRYAQLIDPYVRNFKKKQQFLYNFSCPFCDDSKKKKSKARGYIFYNSTKNTNHLFYHCHNCQISTSIKQLLKHLDERLFYEYVAEMFKDNANDRFDFRGQGQLHSNSNVDGDSLADGDGDSDHDELIDRLLDRLDTLPTDHHCYKYARDRKIPLKKFRELYYLDDLRKLDDDKFPVEDARMIIPVRNRPGKLIGLIMRDLTGTAKSSMKYLIKMINHNYPLIYGLDKLDLNKQGYVVEGPLDSFFLQNCIAACTSDLTRVSSHVITKNMVFVFDHQPRNHAVMKQLRKAIESGYKVCIWPDEHPHKDINDMILGGMSEGQVQTLIDSNTYEGMQARLKFAEYRKDL